MPSKTVTLNEAIKLDGRTITEVVVRSPKVREIRQMQEAAKNAAAGVDSLDETLSAILLLSDLPPEATDELDGTDIQTISEAIAGFFPQARG